METPNQQDYSQAGTVQGKHIRSVQTYHLYENITTHDF